MAIKNLLFDLGGVVIDIRRELCVKAYKKLGMENPDEYLDLYTQRGPFLKIENGEIGIEQFIAEIRSILTRPATDDQIIRAFCQFLVGIPSYRLYALEELRKHYRVYALSNTNPLMMEYDIKYKFMSCGKNIDHYFDGKVLSYEAKSTKPDRAIFEYAIQHLGIVPEETLFFDDSQRNLEAAAELGFQTALVEPGTEFIDVCNAILPDVEL